MKKKFWLLLLMVIGMLSGCKGKEAEETVLKSEENVHISMFMGVDFWEAPQWELTEGTITGDITRDTGVTVDFIARQQNPNRQLSLMLINDELPDVISVTDSTVINQLVTSGKVWNLEEFFQTYKPDSHVLDRFPEDMKYELTRRDGGWYAWPSHINSSDARETWKACDECYEDMAEYGDNKTIIWNLALLEKLGIQLESIQTEEDVLRVLELAKGNGSMIPLMIDGDMWQDHVLAFLMGTFGAEYVDDAGDYMDALRQPEAKDALAFMNRLIRKGYAEAEQLAFTTAQIQEKLKQEDVLCFIGNISNTGVDFREWSSSGAIQSSKGSTPVLGITMKTTGWINTFISKDCRYPEQIAAWFDYMTSDEGMMLWAFGYEGKDYWLDEEQYVNIVMDGENGTRKSYAENGIDAWWMFTNTAWVHSVARSWGAEKADFEIETAYAKDAGTVRYDRSLIVGLLQELSDGNEYEAMETEVDQWKSTQLKKVILASTDAQFEQEYEKLMQGLEEKGIEKLDQMKNEIYQKRCLEYGEKIRRVNLIETEE